MKDICGQTLVYTLGGPEIRIALWNGICFRPVKPLTRCLTEEVSFVRGFLLFSVNILAHKCPEFFMVSSKTTLNQSW